MVRFERLTPTEKRFVRAIAGLGARPHRSGDVADVPGRTVTTVALIRNALIAKGFLYGPAHGDTAFAVPLFDGFMERIMPNLQVNAGRGRRVGAGCKDPTFRRARPDPPPPKPGRRLG